MRGRKTTDDELEEDLVATSGFRGSPFPVAREVLSYESTAASAHSSEFNRRGESHVPSLTAPSNAAERSHPATSFQSLKGGGELTTGLTEYLGAGITGALCENEQRS